MPQNTLPGGGVGVCVYEAADGGVIIAGLQIVEAGFGIVVVAAIPQGLVSAMVPVAVSTLPQGA